MHPWSRLTSFLAAGVVSFAAAVAAAPPVQAAPVTAASLPAMLSVQAEDGAHDYSRDYFPLWIDADGDGCNTRYEVLIAESTTQVTVGAGCSLSGGAWLSPYDDVTWTDPADVDIDHMVALAEAWRSGAWAWTADQRTQYANDLDVDYALVAVTDNVNQAKGDQDPAEWLPPYTPFQCQYVIDWALVKYRWSLSIDPAEEAAVVAMLSGACGDTIVTLPTQQVSTTTPAGGAVTGFPDGITRLAGATRYETAIQVSQRYAPGVPAVYVATGTNFPDALSAAAAAAQVGGPLLLTSPTALPSAVKTEITRLNPARIYLLGGTAAVSSAVATTLATIAPVTRYDGADRYATGLNIVNSTFASAATAMIATGRSFPDALAATGAAGKVDAPVILVDGTRSTVTSDTLSALTRLGVRHVTVAGGTAVVSTGIVTQLQSLGLTVTRYGGSDRYATAALINNAYFPTGSTDTMFLATGTNFPDALAGAALAGRLGAPQYVTAAACAPAPIHDSVAALAPGKTAVLGGTAVVSDIAAMNWECPPGKLFPDPVTPGAFCASTYSGWYGYTTTGTLMRCTTTATDSRLRWRAA
ncbi:cell wall-binding repeat-containing protein [Intrasporangium calvum]|uniref:cell wall-binding repeat-containing protein n=1 Tax=Intrasporangium calvum TaxID=53358 RepID=UPI000DF6191C|nr:cell wall-binding repeat-containing protein [Intrasporangium calvum]AXG12158.1 hypothetical protein DN585_00750 [Intrasporangium calvum]